MTLQDVARTAGVSLATVDRVVNRRDGVRQLAALPAAFAAAAAAAVDPVMAMVNPVDI